MDDISDPPESVNSSKKREHLFSIHEIDSTGPKKHEEPKIEIPTEAFVKGTLLEQWIDEYFLCFFPKRCNNKRADQVIHGLINMLLKIGETEIDGKPATYQTITKIRKHEAEIFAIMQAIKPGLFDTLFKKFNKEIVKEYLVKLKGRQVSQKSKCEIDEKDHGAAKGHAH